MLIVNQEELDPWDSPAHCYPSVLSIEPKNFSGSQAVSKIYCPFIVLSCSRGHNKQYESHKIDSEFLSSYVLGWNKFPYCHGNFFFNVVLSQYISCNNQEVQFIKLIIYLFLKAIVHNYSMFQVYWVTVSKCPFELSLLLTCNFQLT